MKSNKRICQILLVCIGVMLSVAGCKKEKALTHNNGAAMSVDDFIAKKGGGGTEILITGTNFSTDTAQLDVVINGNQLTIIGASATQIIAVVPKKCGSGKVVVKAGGDSAVSVDIFNYVFTRTVSTLAGTGKAGFANGPAADAMFNFNGEGWYRSMGLAVDNNLNVFVADPGNHCIRKIDSSGNVTTFAGNPGNGGYADGQGTAAQFSLPYSLALDADGNLYSADPGNWDIRKISPDGNAVTLLFGAQAPWAVAVDKRTGTAYYTSCEAPGSVYKINGKDDATAIISGLNYPAGMDFDKEGNLYITLHGDQVIKKFEANTWASSIIAGQVATAGYVNGPGASAQFSYPWGLAVDANANVYVAGNGTWDGGAYNADQSIRYVQAGTWDVSTFAGSSSAGYADAIGEAAAFGGPTGVAVDKNGTVYVMDKNNNRIRKIVSE